MNTLVIAHGGGRCYGPPNSLIAIQQSINLKVDMVEIDVQMSKDEIPVVSHEHDLFEFTDLRIKFPEINHSCVISDLTLNELKHLNTGTWFIQELQKNPRDAKDYLQTLTTEERKIYIEPHIESFKETQIPTLEEVLQEVKKHSVKLNIELKQLPLHYPQITKKVIALVEQYKMESQVIISCFDHEQLAISKECNPNIETAVLVREKLYAPHVYCSNLKASAYSISCIDVMDSIGIQSQYYRENKKLPINKFINELSNSNIALNVWTVNEVEHLKALLELGVNGIFTDYPHRLQQR